MRTFIPALALVLGFALLSPSSAFAKDEFENAFKYELGRIAAHEAVGGGKHLLGAILFGHGHHARRGHGGGHYDKGYGHGGRRYYDDDYGHRSYKRHHYRRSYRRHHYKRHHGYGHGGYGRRSYRHGGGGHHRHHRGCRH